MFRGGLLRRLLLLALIGAAFSATSAPAFAAGPANDAWQNAERTRFNELYPGYTTTGTNVGATKAAGEPAHAGDPGGASVWYEFFPSYGGTWMTFQTEGSTFDTVLAVYERDFFTGAPTTLVASNDDSGAPGGASEVGFLAEYRSYLVAVDGKAGATGSIALRWHLLRPPNDDFVDARVVTGETGSAAEQNVGATREDGEPTHHGLSTEVAGQRSIWFRWTAPRDGIVAFDHRGSTPLGTPGSGIFISSATVYTGTTLATLVPVPGTRFEAVAGTTYTIAVWTPAGFNGGNVLLRWGYRPANDDFADALAVSGDRATLTGSTLGASAEAGEPMHSDLGSSGTPSVWYRWTAPSAGTVTVTKPDGIAVSAYTGSSVDALTLAGRTSFAAAAGQEFMVAVAGLGSFTVTLDVGAPANDRASAAQSIRFNQLHPGFSTTGSTLGATKEAGEPNHAGNPGGASIWFEYFPSYGPTDVTFETDGSGFDTLLAVYERNVFTGEPTTLVASNDDSGAAGGASRLSFTAEYRSYLVVVDGKDGAAGAVALRWYLTQPANDDFADATVLTGESGVVRQSNVGATREPFEPPHHPFFDRPGVNTVWFEWTAPRDGRVAFSDRESTSLGIPGAGGFIPSTTVYTGASLTSLTSLGMTTFDAVAGTTYRIVVWGSFQFGPHGNVVLRWGYQPPNDDFADALAVGGAPVVLSGSTLASTVEPGEPSHQELGGSNSSSVWYRWSVPAGGTATLELTGPGAHAAAYTGSSVSTLTPRGHSSFAVAPGDVVMIAVGGLGPFTLSIELGGPPNDDAGAAQSIRFNELYPGVSTSASTLGATKVPGEPAHAGNPGGASVWFEYFPSYGGTDVTFETDGSGFDTLLAVYERDRFTGAPTTLVASNDDSGAPGGASRLSFTAHYQSYLVVVDGKDGAAGAVALRWYLAKPANDDFANATVLTGESGSATTKNVGATREDGEPSHHGIPNQVAGQRSVWFRWTAPRDGVVAFDDSGSTPLGTPGSGIFISDLTVYTGSTLGTLVVGPSRFAATAGTTYTIAGWTPAGFNGGNLVVRWAYAPANDDFADAQLVAGADVTLTGNTVGASTEVGEPAHTFSTTPSLWYSWVAPRDGVVTMGPRGGEAPPAAVVFYAGSSVGALTRIGSTSFAVAGGTEYAIAVAAGGSRGTFAAPFSFRAANTAPTAEDVTVTTSEDTAVAIDVAASDAEGDALSLTWSAPAHGTFDGATYVPAPDFHGTDSFTYAVHDGELGSQPATVTIEVAPVNDAPVARDVELATDEDAPLAVSLGGTDVDGDALAVAWTQPAHGSFDGATYVPAANFHGLDSLTYTVDDGNGGVARASVTIVVLPVNDAPAAEPATVATDEDTPVALALGATDVDGDELELTVVDGPAHGSFDGGTYTPAANFNGADAIVFRASDGTLSSTATVAIDVAPVNDAPTVALAAAAAAIDEGGSTGLTATATDVDGDALAFAWSAGSGTVSGSGAAVSYANADGPRTDTVAVVVDDGHGGTARATVAIDVRNVAPTAAAGGPYGGTVLDGVTFSGSATDPAGGADALTFEWDLDYDGASFTVDATGQTVSRGLGFPGSYVVALRVSDEDGGVSALSLADVVVTAPASTDGKLLGSLEWDGGLAQLAVHSDGGRLRGHASLAFGGLALELAGIDSLTVSGGDGLLFGRTADGRALRLDVHDGGKDEDSVRVRLSDGFDSGVVAGERGNLNVG